MFNQLKKFILFHLLIIYLLLINLSIKIYIFNANNIRKYNFTNLIPIPKNKKNPIFLLEKKKLLEVLSKGSNKNITRISTIFLNTNARFGNMLTMILKAIFYCQILRCKIILNKKQCWFIQKNIIDKKIKLIIESKEKNNIKKSNMLIDTSYNLLFYFGYFIPVYRYDLIREEIMNNLPKVNIFKNDLYIYIRSGDIFYKFKPSIINYIQPPLCFYKEVLSLVMFREINLIAENTNNPVIKELLNLYPFIKHKKQNLKLDIACLVNAYNIAGGGKSTFFQMILPMNHNLENLWIFLLKIRHNKQLTKKIKKKKTKIEDLFHKFKKQLFIMYSSKDYYQKMWPFKSTLKQRNLLLNYTCQNSFILNKEFVLDKIYYINRKYMYYIKQ